MAIKTNEQGIQRAMYIQDCSSSATFKAAFKLSFYVFAMDKVEAGGTDQEKLDTDRFKTQSCNSDF